MNDEGPYASAFETTFHVDGLAECNAQIDFVEGGIGFTPLYALIKDGKASPNWYLYDTSDWDWNSEPLQFEGFWPNDGADRISHVSIYGTSFGTHDVPDGGTTAAMLGLSLLGLRFLLRRKH